MSIEYVLPLERAVSRMKTMLFKPFRLETWLTLGFAAFLVHAPVLFSVAWQQGVRFTIEGQGDNAREVADSLRSTFAEPIWLLAAAVVLILVLAISTALLWINCRARFVFLDDVVRDRVAIAEPWKRHARLGDSLFLWIVVYGAVALLVWGVFAIPLFVVVVSALGSGFGPSTIGALALFGVAGFGLFVAGAYISFFLQNFIVPIMYRDAVPATRAWGKFLPLLRAHYGRFLACGLWILLLWILVGISLVFAGCMTCCCGFLLMVIPYVGSVLLLPISVSYRAFGPEFLAQFGAEWSVFEPRPGTGGAAPASPEEPSSPLAPPVP